MLDVSCRKSRNTRGFHHFCDVSVGIRNTRVIPTFQRARQENPGEPTSFQKSRKSRKSRNARGFPALFDVSCRKSRNTRVIPTFPRVWFCVLPCVEENPLVARKAGKVGTIGIREVFRPCLMYHVGIVGIHESFRHFQERARRTHENPLFRLSVMSRLENRNTRIIPTFPRARQENPGEIIRDLLKGGSLGEPKSCCQIVPNRILN